MRIVCFCKTKCRSNWMGYATPALTADGRVDHYNMKMQVPSCCRDASVSETITFARYEASEELASSFRDHVAGILDQCSWSVRKVRYVARVQEEYANVSMHCSCHDQCTRTMKASLSRRYGYVFSVPADTSEHSLLAGRLKALAAQPPVVKAEPVELPPSPAVARAVTPDVEHPSTRARQMPAISAVAPPAVELAPPSTAASVAPRRGVLPPSPAVARAATPHVVHTSKRARQTPAISAVAPPAVELAPPRAAASDVRWRGVAQAYFAEHGQWPTAARFKTLLSEASLYPSDPKDSRARACSILLGAGAFLYRSASLTCD